MSKKNYKAIAAAFYGERPAPAEARLNKTIQWRQDVNALADVLAADSDRFDRERFIEACETGKCRGMKQVTQ